MYLFLKRLIQGIGSTHLDVLINQSAIHKRHTAFAFQFSIQDEAVDPIQKILSKRPALSICRDSLQELLQFQRTFLNDLNMGRVVL